MAIVFPELTPERKQVMANAKDMAESIIAEMKKRGMSPDDWMEIQSTVDRTIYNETKSVWKDN